MWNSGWDSAHTHRGSPSIWLECKGKDNSTGIWPMQGCTSWHSDQEKYKVVCISLLLCRLTWNAGVTFSRQ